MENDMNKLVRVFDVMKTVTEQVPERLYDVRAKGRLDNQLRAIMAIPAVDAVEARHGRWLDPNGRQTDQERFNWTCSECGHIQHVPVKRGWKEFGVQNKFCAHCGARMDGEEAHNAAD